MFKRITKVAAIAYVVLALSPLVAVALHYAFVEVPRLLSGESAWPPGRDTVTAPERANDLAKKGLMEQLVTFGEGMTGLRKNPQTEAYELYAIGVGQTTLPDERKQMMGLVGGPPARPDLRYASSFPITGAFNNILLFEPKSGEIAPVFSTRVGISSFKYIAGPDFETLVVFATEKDSDKDGRLTEVDMQTVYVYSVKERTLHVVPGVSGNPTDVDDVPGQSYSIVRATQDENGDGAPTLTPTWKARRSRSCCSASTCAPIRRPRSCPRIWCKRCKGHWGPDRPLRCNNRERMGPPKPEK